MNLYYNIYINYITRRDQHSSSVYKLQTVHCIYLSRKNILSEKLRRVLTNCAKSMIRYNRSVYNRWVVVVTIITRIIVYSLRPYFSDPSRVLFPTRLSMIGNGSDQYYISDFKDPIIALTCSVGYIL